MLTSVPGASAWLDFGIAPYSNEAKIWQGAPMFPTKGVVNPEYIAAFGAHVADSAGVDVLLIESCISKPLREGARSRKPVGSGVYAILLKGLVVDAGELTVGAGAVAAETMNKLGAQALQKLREVLENNG